MVAPPPYKSVQLSVQLRPTRSYKVALSCQLLRLACGLDACRDACRRLTPWGSNAGVKRSQSKSGRRRATHDLQLRPPADLDEADSELDALDRAGGSDSTEGAATLMPSDGCSD